MENPHKQLLLLLEQATNQRGEVSPEALAGIAQALALVPGTSGPREHVLEEVFLSLNVSCIKMYILVCGRRCVCVCVGARVCLCVWVCVSVFVYTDMYNNHMHTHIDTHTHTQI